MMSQTSVLRPLPTANETPKRVMQLSLAEAKLIERIRACTSPTLFTLYAGGDGEPKQLFAQEGIKREELNR